MTVSISLSVVGLFNFLICFWFNFGKWYLSKKLSIFFKFSSFVGVQVFEVWPDDSLIFLCVSYYVPLFICAFVNLDIHSFCLLVSLDKGLSILLIFSKNQLFVSLILCIVFFVSILLISALNLIIYCHIGLLGEFAAFVLKLSSVLLTY